MAEKTEKLKKIDTNKFQLTRISNLELKSHTFEFGFWIEDPPQDIFKHIKYCLKQHVFDNKKLLNRLIFDFKLPKVHKYIKYSTPYKFLNCTITVYSKEKLPIKDDINLEMRDSFDEIMKDYQIFPKKPNKNLDIN